MPSELLYLVVALMQFCRALLMYLFYQGLVEHAQAKDKLAVVLTVIGCLLYIIYSATLELETDLQHPERLLGLVALDLVIYALVRRTRTYRRDKKVPEIIKQIVIQVKEEVRERLKKD